MASLHFTTIYHANLTQPIGARKFVFLQTCTFAKDIGYASFKDIIMGGANIFVRQEWR